MAREFYNIVDKIKEELRSLPSINTVTFGDLDEIDLDKTTIFPLAHFKVDSVQPQEGALLFDISLLVADIVDYNKEETEFDDIWLNNNLHDVLNTQLVSINSFYQSIKRGGLYKDGYQIVSEPTFEPFKDRFKNLLAGWDGNISILVKNGVKIC